METTQFSRLTAEINENLTGVRGWLTERETHLLATLAACPTAEGEILEIGTYRGRSAIVLACASATADSTPITAIDSLSNRSRSGQTPEEAEIELKTNLVRARVADRIKIHVMTSQDHLPLMDRKLRLLWVDGDHRYEGAHFDIANYSKFLVDGGMIACHDILTPYGCTRAFKELVLENPHFGPVQFCGSIGFAQYHADASATRSFEEERLSLAKRLDRLCRLTERARASKFYRTIYRIYRRNIPHGPVTPHGFLNSGSNRWVFHPLQNTARSRAA